MERASLVGALAQVSHVDALVGSELIKEPRGRQVWYRASERAGLVKSLGTSIREILGDL